ncbi:MULTISPECIES: NAD-dependent epimerase/dehydratase family protein [Roseobacteraceae]|jgi:UDP-glucose 4-epimerase|uniref:UDP-glucose 4-epimerase n=1 Tax=Sulfitobacter pacificus TaxID=1499314 RepID=A0ABQ5VQY1_9RHOB|nr:MULTISPECIES: NAD(P)-dependent oxidoreductase [Roseobacteraceae]MDE4099465.1 NAD(P)-dependent oxidoreductase [Phaeobacter gallaeciensis]MDE4108266.1 NAD(P)-dependent oxidoreductase [Phaeobacter gallaeciensis]MDE4112970.1 NAD(P)-dependent oxidoreductase [Phaeobacter gallaeciensis]MDE4117581.1 NAD(P)-dependent oxidoreductase [Phaeobacter gallaeciensis]MDE4121913.1 NAD(P)-dependent oxidoreductase [Phaeobacter gallaeciensis]
MKVLVTGGLGVNGAFVTRELVGRGHSVVIVDRQKDMSLLGSVAGEVELYNIDIMDREAMTELMTRHKVDGVIHMAALISGLQEDPLKGFTVNGLGAVQLMDAAHKSGAKRFVYTSSRAVYGNILGEHAYPTYKPVTEAHPLEAHSVYDVTKLAGEMMGRNFVELGLEFVALRFATIYGPGKLVRHGPMGILSRIIENGMLGVPLEIPQGGDERDDIIYVGDVGRSCVAALEHEKPGYTEYNISSGTGVTLEEFAEATRTHVPGVDFTIGPGLDFFNTGVRYAGILDNSRARTDLEFTPKYDLKSGVGAYIATMEELGLRPTAT